MFKIRFGRFYVINIKNSADSTDTYRNHAKSLFEYISLIISYVTFYITLGCAKHMFCLSSSPLYDNDCLLYCRDDVMLPFDIGSDQYYIVWNYYCVTMCFVLYR